MSDAVITMVQPLPPNHPVFTYQVFSYYMPAKRLDMVITMRKNQVASQT